MPSKFLSQNGENRAAVSKGNEDASVSTLKVDTPILRGDKNKSGLLWLNAKFTAKMDPTKTYYIPNHWKFYEDFAEL